MSEEKTQKQGLPIDNISCQALRRFILDARAFIAYGCSKGLSNTAMLSNLAHDIFGLAIGDKLMLPRVTGYSNEHPFTQEGHIVEGSSLGVLLPLFNKTERNESES